MKSWMKRKDEHKHGDTPDPPPPKKKKKEVNYILIQKKQAWSTTFIF